MTLKSWHQQHDDPTNQSTAMGVDQTVERREESLTLGQLLVPRLDDVREDYALLAVELPQLPGQPRPQLAQPPRDEDPRPRPALAAGAGGEAPGGRDLEVN